ncbi:MAG: hypothetical protein ABIG61_09510 [Planctomycetota bacterium]
MNLRQIACLMVTLALSFSAGALTYDLGIEYGAGVPNGANSMTFVIDFGLESYAFEYKWNGEMTGWDALDSIDLAGAVDVNATYWGSEWGYFVNDLGYLTAEKFDYGLYQNVGWHYYGSADGQNWVLNPGVSSRQLSDGVWDCFVWTNYDEWWSPLRGPGGVPVPEPVSLSILGIAAIALRSRKELKDRA